MLCLMQNKNWCIFRLLEVRDNRNRYLIKVYWYYFVYIQYFFYSYCFFLNCDIKYFIFFISLQKIKFLIIKVRKCNSNLFFLGFYKVGKVFFFCLNGILIDRRFREFFQQFIIGFNFFYFLYSYMNINLSLYCNLEEIIEWENIFKCYWGRSLKGIQRFFYLIIGKVVYLC